MTDPIATIGTALAAATADGVSPRVRLLHAGVARATLAKARRRLDELEVGGAAVEAECERVGIATSDCPTSTRRWRRARAR